MISSLIISAISGVTASSLWALIFRDWLSARLRASIQHDYDRKLEIFKADLKKEQEMAILSINTAIARETSFHAQAHGAFAAGQKASMERKLNAVDGLWSCVLQLRSGSPLLKIIDVMQVAEYDRAKDSSEFRKLTESLSMENLATLVPKNIEEARPYVGEYMWYVFHVYQMILVRTLVLVHHGKTSTEKVEWYKDEGTRQLVEAVLTPEELQAFDRLEFGKMSYLQQYLESKMLLAAHKVISGETFGAESLRQAAAIQQRIARLSPEAILPRRT